MKNMSYNGLAISESQISLIKDMLSRVTVLEEMNDGISDTRSRHRVSDRIVGVRKILKDLISKICLEEIYLTLNYRSLPLSLGKVEIARSHQILLLP